MRTFSHDTPARQSRTVSSASSGTVHACQQHRFEQNLRPRDKWFSTASRSGFWFLRSGEMALVPLKTTVLVSNFLREASDDWRFQIEPGFFR